MPNYRNPPDGVTLTGPVNMLMADGSYVPLLQYSKPPGVTGGAPTTAQVQALCKLLAPLAAEQVVKQSAMLSRITVLPQQYPSTGYSSLGITYNYPANGAPPANQV